MMLLLLFALQGLQGGLVPMLVHAAFTAMLPVARLLVTADDFPHQALGHGNLLALVLQDTSKALAI